MKIATYNVNGINGRLPVLLRWLNETSPDIVCLQELKAPEEKFPEAAIKDAGYRALWHGQKSWNGVAILARDKEIKEVCRVLPGDPFDGRGRSGERGHQHAVQLAKPRVVARTEHLAADF